MENKLISVVIPIYNCEAYLAECLDSVVNQSYSNIEIILVNDGSVDRSEEICLSYAQADPRIVYISQENRGSSAARNHGISAARGEWIMFLDSDDLLARKACEHVCRETQDRDLIILDYQAFRNASEICNVSSEPETAGMELGQYSRKDWVCSQLGPTRTVPAQLNLYTVWAKAYRRQFLEENGIAFSQDVIIGEDVLFNLGVYLKVPRGYSLPVKSYFYRYNSESVVHRYSPNYRVRDQKYIKTLETVLAKENFREEMHREVDHQKAIGFLQILSRDIFHRNNPKDAAQKKADFYALVNDGEYSNILRQQMKFLPAGKRCIAFFSAKKLYFPIKALYCIKDLLNDIRQRKRA